MEQPNTNVEPASIAPKPVNWYSGWRLLASAAITVLSAKLIGILGTVVAAIVFYWLQPKRGTGQAVIAAVVAGVLVAVVFSAALLPTIYQPQNQPAAQAPATDKEGKPCSQITEFLGECKPQP